MVTFEIVSSQEVTINGVGLLRVDEPVEVTEVMLNHFKAEHGYPLSEAKLPPYVKLTAVTDNQREV